MLSTICVGGFSLKEALNLCIKETVEDEVMSFFTFYGIKKKTLAHFSKQNFVLLFKVSFILIAYIYIYIYIYIYNILQICIKCK